MDLSNDACYNIKLSRVGAHVVQQKINGVSQLITTCEIAKCTMATTTFSYSSCFEGFRVFLGEQCEQCRQTAGRVKNGIRHDR